MKYRTGFEPDKSSDGWLGCRVRAFYDNGYIDINGIVVATETRSPELGWMQVLFDNGEELLMHTTEVIRL